jgi:hypothetical protein
MKHVYFVCYALKADAAEKGYPPFENGEVTLDEPLTTHLQIRYIEAGFIARKGKIGTVTNYRLFRTVE